MTRDRNYGKSSWNGKDFSVIDTGGYVSNSDDIFEEEINKQVILALDEADVILFMVDAEIGVTDLDQNFARLLRNIDKPVYQSEASSWRTTNTRLSASDYHLLNSFIIQKIPSGGSLLPVP